MSTPITDLLKLASNKLPDFGKKPIKDVGVILSIVQAGGLSEKDITKTAQDIYTSLYVANKKGNANQARQSWVVASGNNFEDLIRSLINDALNAEGILAIKGDRLRGNKKAAKIVQFLTLKANRRCVQLTTGVWPDSDIVLLTHDQKNDLKVFALLNCKTSDHSRNDAVLFWALALRDNNIKYCLMTQDLDHRFVKGDNNARISSLRRKAEAYLDRVYTTDTTTEICSQVRVLDFANETSVQAFFEELRTWRKEVIRDFSGGPISESAL